MASIDSVIYNTQIILVYFTYFKFYTFQVYIQKSQKVEDFMQNG